LCAAEADALFVFDVRPDWKQIKVARMRKVLSLKFDKARDATLIEASSTDPFWGTGKKGHGENMFGKLLMEIRDESMLSNQVRPSLT
jgi:predicted NAD-dependent protein-ADP-ribosyltransferase YbiA (DUF1768 family)